MPMLVWQLAMHYGKDVNSFEKILKLQRSHAQRRALPRARHASWFGACFTLATVPVRTALLAIVGAKLKSMLTAPTMHSAFADAPASSRTLTIPVCPRPAAK